MSYDFGNLWFVGVCLLVGISVIVFRRQLARASNDFYASQGLRFMVFDEKKLSRGGLVTGPALIVVAIVMAVSGIRR